ncbi:APC family permease [Arthrobacter sp. NicSoilC5]|uniref:APC family permease n=1 Tax=Arthrobacter sp. NicSoilC5 TaxID=2831000 RepID=UPI001CC6A071|nr:APC family permease [Arthrobacter sp. NicSoilC5]BCW78366.1 amino acid permease [Arthrobacter sp. NicSoilC5]
MIDNVSELPATTPSNTPVQPQAGHLRSNKLGVFAIAFFVIAAAAPMAAVVGTGPVVFAAVGPAAPLIYAIAALLIALFAVGYLRMSRHVTNAGGFVAYIAKGLGTPWATAGAGLALLMYLSLQVGLWSQFGVFAGQLLESLTGLSVPPLVWIVALLVITTALTMRGVDTSIRLLAVLIIGETLVVAALVIVLVTSKGPGVFTFSGFTAENLFSPGLGIALLFAFLCFTSFEATVVFSEEAINPRKTIPRALYAVIAFVGIFYTLSIWVIGGAIGVDNIQQAATDDPAGFIFNLASESGGSVLSMAMQVLVVTSYLAMLLGLMNMFARYLFALSRAGVLPARLASVSKDGSPATAALSNGVAVGIVVVTFLVLGADPLTVVFAWFSALATAAFITILIVASVSIVVFFVRTKDNTSIWATKIAPTLSTVILSYIGYVTIENYDSLIGPDNAAAKWLLILIPAAMLGGLVFGRSKRDIDYAKEVI